MAIDSCLVDTNILLRIAKYPVPQNELIRNAVAKLKTDGATLHYTQQNIAELWNVMTRPILRNGFGLTAAEAEIEVRAIEAIMTRLLNSEAAYREWRRMVVAYGVSGSQVHDARLVAAMRVHGVRHILTLNVQDFRRYADIEVVHPSEVSGV